ncbi:hypothetical protein F5B19DRAFT_504004 [Rostrohypoxylon terebratum]|nr:hypothetical protein F5B19DRAFT_504004 [Rostrohypoxylon terebratum]
MLCDILVITSSVLRSQWVNPSDLMSLFLLIGSDVVQQAIAQLVGYELHLPGMRQYGIPITPVALSFGWVAYAFSNLVNVVGDMKLLPTDYQPSIVVNCATGFQRGNRSWILNRLLSDHEIKCDAQTRKDIETKGEKFTRDSIRIDIFQLEKDIGPRLDYVWWLGWVAIIIQLGVAIIPWVLYGDYGTLLVTLGGNLLIAVTCALPQWKEEKWPNAKMFNEGVFCLTRGNGHPYIMVFVGAPGSWDIEKLATGYSPPRKETRWVSFTLAILWTCLLISLSGLQENTLYYMCIGVIGMLHNILAAGATRSSSALNVYMTSYAPVATIIGKRDLYKDDQDAYIDPDERTKELEDIAEQASHGEGVASKNRATATISTRASSSTSEEQWQESNPISNVERTEEGPSERVVGDGVHGALMELEKWVPTAGLAMVQIFFPGGLRYNEAAIRESGHKKFWSTAYATKSIRKVSDEKRRKEKREEVSVPV